MGEGEREGLVEGAAGGADTGLEGVLHCSGGMSSPDAAGGEDVVCAANAPLSSEYEGKRDLGRALDSPVKSMLEEDVELSRVGGNLSPRVGRLPGHTTAPSLIALNVDQAMEIAEGFTQVKTKGIRAKFPSDRQLYSSTSSHNSFNVLDRD